MALDSAANSSVPPFNKDFGKKKRGSRLAKLKQCKLDARREQWLSQAKNKVNKEELLPAPPRPSVLESTKIAPIVEENEGLSDLESLSNSTLSLDSRKDRPGSSCGSSSSSGCCSGNFSEEEDDCLDDWEAVADALCANDKQNSETPPEPELLEKASVELECKNLTVPVNNRCAWRADDAFRPQSLPNLTKREQCRVLYNPNAWARGNAVSVSPPSSCPICYEDLDVTDSSFLPCVCGFRLCLFCYKRIFEVGDCRCPGCRRTYDSVANGATQPVVDRAAAVQVFPRLNRSRSMSTKSRGKVGH